MFTRPKIIFLFIVYLDSLEIPAEKIVITQECELVTLMTRVKGRLDVTSRMFTFTDLDQASEDGEHYDFKYTFPIILSVGFLNF